MPTFSLTPARITSKPRSLCMTPDHATIIVPIDVTLADGSRFHVPYFVHAALEHPTFGDTFGHPSETDAYRLLERLVDHYLMSDTEDEHLLRVLRQMKTVAHEAVDAFFAEVAASLATKH